MEIAVLSLGAKGEQSGNCGYLQVCPQNIEQYVALAFMPAPSDELHGSWDVVEEGERVAGVTASLHIWAKAR